jgi:hypothetical protein
VGFSKRHIELGEFVENAREVMFRDADTRIASADQGRAIVRNSGAYGHGAVRGELERVGRKIGIPTF